MSEKEFIIPAIQELTKKENKDVSQHWKDIYGNIGAEAIKKGITDFSPKNRQKYRDIRHTKINEEKIELIGDGTFSTPDRSMEEIVSKKVEFLDGQIAELTEQRNSLAQKYNIKKIPVFSGLENHIMDEFVENALAKGWAWLYQDGVKARGQTKIYFDAGYWAAFCDRMSIVVNCNPDEIQAIAVTNHSVDYAIDTKENLNRYMREVKLKEFKFEEKDGKDSKHGYGFVKIRGHWYGIVKLGDTWDSQDDARENAGYNLANYAGRYSGSAGDAARAFGLVYQSLTQNRK
ncbi:MAG: hypothetical protein FWE50_01675 [Alphaproteobacteria bacterium]|nr:hypothetical protein [Alphaproteobacteria bacterium]